MIASLLWLLNTVVFLYVAIIIAMIVMSWLTAFKVADPENAVVAQVDRALYALTNPVMNPLRRLIPAVGGLDLSPVIALLLLVFLDRLINGLASAGAHVAA